MEKGVSGANPSSLLKISNRMKKSLMSLVVIYYNLNLLKISYQNGRVSVRIFYKNNSISFCLLTLLTLLTLLNAHSRHRLRRLRHLLLIILLIILLIALTRRWRNTPPSRLLNDEIALVFVVFVPTRPNRHIPDTPLMIDGGR